VIAALLGLAAAASYGGADFLAGVSSRRTGVLPVALLSQLAGLAALLLAFPLASGAPSVDGLAWGGSSGLAAGVGLVLYFRALAVGRMGVVAPTTAVVAAAVPVVVGLVLGERPVAIALVGVAVAVVAVALVSAVPQRAVSPAGVPAGVEADAVAATAPAPGPGGTQARRSHRSPGLAEALVAGAVFGLFFVFLSRSGEGSPWWPLLAANLGSIAVLIAAVALRRPALRPLRGTRWAIAVSGVLGTAGSLLFLLGARAGLLSLVAVLTALSPAGVVVLARVLLNERLARIQLAGLVAALGGAVLIAAG
jgi:drug/metabolite transporter (DMT)-like permease